MEVIDETPDPSVVREKVCTSCGVRLKYLKPDVKRSQSTDYTGGTDIYYTIECPKCGERLNVKPWY